jgi:hypothetical protein
MRPHTVFVSHAHVDNAICDRYVKALQDRDLDIWYDRADMPSGSALSVEITRQLTQRTAFVLMLSPAAIESYWVELETAAFRSLIAVDRERLMLPVRIVECDVPLLLQGLKWIDGASLRFTRAVDEIADALHAPPKRIGRLFESSNESNFAVAISCIDGRALSPVIDWVKVNFSVPFVDVVTIPGPDGALTNGSEAHIAHVRDYTQVSVMAHGARGIIVAGHYSCAAYPVSTEEHVIAIKQAVKVVTAWNGPASNPLRVIGLWINEWGQVEVVADNTRSN